VVRLVALAQTAQDRDRVLDTRLADEDLLEAALQRGSFSIRSRYSSRVVAPIIRSSPRASIGLSMLPASIEESPVAPAPTTVCSSSMKVIT
jgi:hypothetical protein